jgi:hypothetical protein
MSKSNHPIEQEELMAYLDGELATNRAVAAAAHLEHCAECQELAAGLRKMSQEMMAWEVEQSGSGEISAEVGEALDKRKREPKRNVINRPAWKDLLKRRWQWIPGLTALGLILVLILTPSHGPLRQSSAPMQGYFGSPQSGPSYSSTKPKSSSTAGKPVDDVISQKTIERDRGLDSFSSASFDKQENGYVIPPPPPPGSPSPYVPGKTRIDTGLRGNDGPSPAGDKIDSSERTLDLPTVPMIARVAGLILTTKEFDKTRANLEEILKRHNGYMGELKVSAPADAGRTLTATLRIPAPQLEAALAELKKLGRVEDESQGGEEVTQQYVDLEARLANGKHTEQRLTEILRQRTGKLQDVLKVELEIDRVRGEVEQMQAEKKELSKRVAFATLNTTVKEEYLARLQGAPPSTGSRFRNAAVDGYNTVVEGLIDVGLFLLSAGPSLLLWAAILFFPARWAWKKFRSTRRRDAEEEETV